MRENVLVTVIFVAILVAEGTNSGSCVPLVKLRAEPREIRAYQPKDLSTAIWFGKREGAKQDKYEKIMLLLLHNSPQSIPVSWILHEMKKNPELAKQILKKLEDDNEEENPGKLSTSELFRSERTISFF